MHPTLSRIVAVSLWAVASALLTIVVKPERPQQRAALATGVTLAVMDYALEFLADRLGIWRYHLQGTFLGLPPDLAADFFLLGYSFCLLYVAYSRRLTGRATVAVFVVASGGVLGTVAFAHNRVAAAEGFVSFAPGFGPGDPWFAPGHYALMTAAAAAIVWAYRYALRRLSSVDSMTAP